MRKNLVVIPIFRKCNMYSILENNNLRHEFLQMVERGLILLCYFF